MSFSVIDNVPEYYPPQLLFILKSEGMAIDLFSWEFGGAGSMLLFFAPTHFVDITYTFELKCKALKAFESQFEDHNTDHFLIRARKRGEQWGKIAGMKFAEPFMQFTFTGTAGETVPIPETYNSSAVVKELA